MSEEKPTCGDCEHWERRASVHGECAYELIPSWVWGHEDDNAVSTYVVESDLMAGDCPCFARKANP